MSNLLDTDLLLVERAGASYKVTVEDFGLNSGGTLGGFEQPVEVLTPSNGAGIGLNPFPYIPISSKVIDAKARNGYYNIQFEDATNLGKMVGPVEMRLPDGSEIFPETSAITSVTQNSAGVFTFGDFPNIQYNQRPEKLYMGQASSGTHAGKDVLVGITERDLPESRGRSFYYSLDYGETWTGFGAGPSYGWSYDICFFKGKFAYVGKNRSPYNTEVWVSGTDLVDNTWTLIPDPRMEQLGFTQTTVNANYFNKLKIVNNRLYMWGTGDQVSALWALDDWDEGFKLVSYAGTKIANINYSIGQYIISQSSTNITNFSDDGIAFTGVLNDSSFQAHQDSGPNYILGASLWPSVDGRTFKSRGSNGLGGGAFCPRLHAYFKNSSPNLDVSVDGFYGWTDRDDIIGTTTFATSCKAKLAGYTAAGETVIGMVKPTGSFRPEYAWDLVRAIGVYRTSSASSKTQVLGFGDSKDFEFLSDGDQIDGTDEYIVSIDRVNNTITTTANVTTFTNGQTLKTAEKESIADVISNQTGNGLDVGGSTGFWYPGTIMFGQTITDTAPSPDDVQFTSMNGGSTKVTGSNVSLDYREWTLEENQSGSWVTVSDAVKDYDVLASQDGASKWSGRPTLKPNTEYRVLVTYNSANADSSTSTYHTFKTGV